MGSANIDVINTQLFQYEKLPYDAEVEYLESSNAQWIDTGVFPDRVSDSFDIRVMIMSATRPYSSFCGSQNASTSVQYYTLGTAASSSSVRFFDPLCGPVDVPSETWMDIHVANGDVTIAGSRFTPTMASGIFSSHFALFGRLLGNAFVSSGAFRIASLSYYTNSVLVRDMIPVRFTNELGQSEGAMYDRVSKQLFRNQGTGSFLYGADKIPIETNRYVQDGLIAMWDGKENAGVGLHDPNAMVWKDLSPSGFDLTNQQGAFDSEFFWKDDCIYCNDGRLQRFYGAKGGVPQSLVNAVNSGDVTIEGVVRHLRKTNAGALVSQLYEGSNVQNLSILCPVLGGKAAIREPWRTYGLTYGLHGTTAPLVATSPSYLCVVKRSDSSMSSTSIVDGKSYFATGTSGNANPMTTTGRFALMAMGSLSFWSGRHTLGELYAIRIYSRALTSAEIAANYAVDKARFNLP